MEYKRRDEIGGLSFLGGFSVFYNQLFKEVTFYKNLTQKEKDHQKLTGDKTEAEEKRLSPINLILIKNTSYYHLQVYIPFTLYCQHQ